MKKVKQSEITKLRSECDRLHKLLKEMNERLDRERSAQFAGYPGYD
jgi:hypothetical protein